MLLGSFIATNPSTMTIPTLSWLCQHWDGWKQRFADIHWLKCSVWWLFWGQILKCATKTFTFFAPFLRFISTRSWQTKAHRPKPPTACFINKGLWGDLPGGPVAKTLHPQCRWPRFDSCQGTRFHMPQLRICMLNLKKKKSCMLKLKDPACWN